MIKHSIIYISSSFLSKATPFILLPVLTMYLSPDEMGNISLFLSLVSLFVILCSLSTHGIIPVDFFRLGKERLKYSITTICMVIFFVTVSMGAIFFLYRELLPSITNISYVYFNLALIVASCQIFTFVNLSLWQSEGEPIKFGFYEVSQSLLNISLSLYLVVVLKLADDGRIFGYSISYFFFFLLSLLILFKRKLIVFSLNFQRIREVLRFGVLLMPHAIALWITANISRFFLANLMNNTYVGIYFVATQLGIVITVVALATQKAFVPYMYNLLNDKRNAEQSRRKVVIAAYYYFIFTFLLAAAAFLVFSLIFKYYEVSEYLAALDILPWILAGVLFHSWGIFFTNITLYTKETQYVSIATFIAACFHIIVSYFAIKFYGLLGAAISFTITNFIALVLSAFTSNLLVPLSWRFRNTPSQ